MHPISPPPTPRLVTVVVPLYRGEKHLRECLTSLAKQTYPHLEIICVDDGSPDSSADIADEYAQSDSRFRVISQENRGLSEARNRGVVEATGEYVIFVDQDDALRLKAIEYLVAVAEQTKPVAIVFGYQEVTENAPVAALSEEVPEGFGNNLPAPSRSSKKLVRGFVEDWWEPRAQLLFLRRANLIANGPQFFPGILHEDNLYTFQLLSRTSQLVEVEHELSLVRQTSGSMTRATKTWHHVFSLVVTRDQMVSEVKRTPRESVGHLLGQRYVIHHVLDQAVDAFHQMPRGDRLILSKKLKDMSLVSRRTVWVFRLNTWPVVGVVAKGFRHHLWRFLRWGFLFFSSPNDLT